MGATIPAKGSVKTPNGFEASVQAVMTVDPDGNYAGSGGGGGNYGGLTNEQLRASPVPVSIAELEIKNDAGNPLPVKDDEALLRFGTVEANPGANTILGRLKSIASALAGLVLGAGEAHIGQVGGHTIRANASFVRPADTAAYAIGDLVANSTASGAVVPMTFVIGRVDGASKGGMIRRARLRKTGTSIANASFRLHLYVAVPVASNGDNGAWLTNGAASYVGSFDITCDKVFTDGASGNGLPSIGGEINFTADTYYGVLEARGAYVPTNAESFTVTLETLQN